MKKIVSTFLITMLANLAFGANAFGQTNAFKENRLIGQIGEPKIEASQNENDDSAKQQFQAQFDKKFANLETTSDLGKVEKETMASHQKNKSAGKKYSTKTKIFIGVGIAAAVTGIVIFAASRTKFRLL